MEVAARLAEEAAALVVAPVRQFHVLGVGWACWTQWATGGTVHCQPVLAEAGRRMRAASVVKGRMEVLGGSSTVASVEHRFLAAVTLRPLRSMLY